MNNYLVLLVLFLSLLSCTQKTNLQKEFLCETNSISATEEIIDFKNKFSIEVPKTWKTQLYYDTVQTQIMTADTTKNFTNTYALIFEYNSGNLKIDDSFLEKELNKLQKDKLLVLKNKKDNFKGKPCIWFVSKGKKLKYDYYYFEMFVKQNKNHYFKVSSDIYGGENIDERFCESIAYIETLKFID
jgi:hypothetical protein